MRRAVPVGIVRGPSQHRLPSLPFSYRALPCDRPSCGPDHSSKVPLALLAMPVPSRAVRFLVSSIDLPAAATHDVVACTARCKLPSAFIFADVASPTFVATQTSRLAPNWSPYMRGRLLVWCHIRCDVTIPRCLLSFPVAGPAYLAGNLHQRYSLIMCVIICCNGQFPSVLRLGAGAIRRCPSSPVSILCLSHPPSSIMNPLAPSALRMVVFLLTDLPYLVVGMRENVSLSV